MIPEYGCLAFIFKGRRFSFFFSAGKVSGTKQKLGRVWQVSPLYYDRPSAVAIPAAG
jgi:hypothetical protein